MMFRRPTAKEGVPNPRSTRRQVRAEALRRQALSPVRILIMVLALPLTTAMIAIGVFLRTSDFERHEAVIHLVALAGCEAVGALGFGPFRDGQAGYHKRNDPDGDGVACGTFTHSSVSGAQALKPTAPHVRAVGNAKFVKP